jgi:hypothetical protein
MMAQLVMSAQIFAIVSTSPYRDICQTVALFMVQFSRCLPYIYGNRSHNPLIHAVNNF